MLYFCMYSNRFFPHLFPVLLSLAWTINNILQRSVVIPLRQKACDVLSSGMALVNTLFTMLNILAAHQKAEQRGAE